MECDYRRNRAYLDIQKKINCSQDAPGLSTRWNSTYDMLKFACTYREAIDKIMDDRSMKLREFELKDDEWKIVEELRDTLKVSFHYFTFFCVLIFF